MQTFNIARTFAILTLRPGSFRRSDRPRPDLPRTANCGRRVSDQPQGFSDRALRAGAAYRSPGRVPQRWFRYQFCRKLPERFSARPCPKATPPRVHLHPAWWWIWSRDNAFSGNPVADLISPPKLPSAHQQQTCSRSALWEKRKEFNLYCGIDRLHLKNALPIIVPFARSRTRSYGCSRWCSSMIFRHTQCASRPVATSRRRWWRW